MEQMTKDELNCINKAISNLEEIAKKITTISNIYFKKTEREFISDMIGFHEESLSVLKQIIEEQNDK